MLYNDELILKDILADPTIENEIKLFAILEQVARGACSIELAHSLLSQNGLFKSSSEALSAAVTSSVNKRQLSGSIVERIDRKCISLDLSKLLESKESFLLLLRNGDLCVTHKGCNGLTGHTLQKESLSIEKNDFIFEKDFNENLSSKNDRDFDIIAFDSFATLGGCLATADRLFRLNNVREYLSWSYID